MMKINLGLPQILVPTVASAIVVTQVLPANALTGQEVNNISREVTVLIEIGEGENSGNGSGVIIARDGDTYHVLTAQHVVASRENRDGEIPYRIITHDKKPHTLDFDTVTVLPNGLDLAVFEFESDEDYPVATLGNSDLVTEGIPVFVSGWPQPGSVSDVTQQRRIRQFTTGRVSTVLEMDFRGYQIGYDNNTFRGMSGGPVVDASGRLVAIHGQADSVVGSPEIQVSPGNGDPEALRQVMTNLGFNYGIPINTFLQNISQAGLSNLDLDIDDSPPPAELSAPYVASDEPDSRDVIEDVGSVLNLLERGLRIICVFGGC